MAARQVPGERRDDADARRSSEVHHSTCGQWPVDRTCRLQSRPWVWTSSGPSQLQVGPLALTRAACPAGSLHDQIVKQWSFIRSYVIRDGHLFLALMADGGIYEFEPVAVPAVR